MEGMLEGRVDLLFGDGEGWTIVDYKTDAVRPGGEAERALSYKAQAVAYAVALDAVGLPPSDGVYILFARTGQAVRIEVTDEDIACVRDHILAAARQD